MNVNSKFWKIIRTIFAIYIVLVYCTIKRVAQTIAWSWNRNDFRCIVYTFISNLLVQKMPHNDNGTTCQPTFDTNTWLCINSTKQWLINKWFTINTFKWFIFFWIFALFALVCKLLQFHISSYLMISCEFANELK